MLPFAPKLISFGAKILTTMQNSAYKFYSKTIQELETEIRSVKRKSFLLYVARLVLFLLFFAFIVLYIKANYNAIFLGFAVISIVSFFIVVKQNLLLEKFEKILFFKLIINQSEIQSINYEFKQKPSGNEFQAINLHLSVDFDIFGEGSIYQYLNRSVTQIGRKRFAENLCKSELKREIIIRKQEAIRELSNKIRLIQDFQAHGMLNSEKGDEISNLNLWLNEPVQDNRLLNFLSFFIPCIVFVWIGLIAFGYFSITSMAIPILVSLSIVGFNNKKIVEAHSKLNSTAKIFEKYFTLIKLIEDDDYNAERLNSIKNRLVEQDEKASAALKSLFKLLNSFDVRLNIFAFFVLNTLFLYDIHVFCRLAKWKSKHSQSVDQWFDALAEFDSLLGLATFAYNNQEQVSYPEVMHERFAFRAEDIGHPLIHSTIRINNSIQFGGMPAVIIVTGANMAGKSTFLRTVAVNLILAMNGAPVCAKKFAFTPCDIMSSIKIQDSLTNNESYFYAELLRIKEIIEHVEKQPQTLVVLDEILRGTNTKDKQLGSLGLLEKLIGLKSVVIVATHDLVIGELERKYPEFVKNHCFEVELIDEQLVFDYKLKHGISQKLNASFLMKKMGIVD